MVLKNQLFLIVALLLFPLTFIYMGYFSIIEIVIWILIFGYFVTKQDIKWYIKLAVPIIADVILVFAIGR